MCMTLWVYDARLSVKSADPYEEPFFLLRGASLCLVNVVLGIDATVTLPCTQLS